MINGFVRRYGAVSALLLAPFGTVRASLVLSANQDPAEYEFGTGVTLLSLQTQSLFSIEQGCNPFGTEGFGAYTASDNNFAGTGVNVGNYCDETKSQNTGSNPANNVPSGTTKTALPALLEVGISSANAIGVLFNTNQLNNEGISSISLTALVLSFYTNTGDVIFSATLAPNFCSSFIGTLCSGSKTFAFHEPGQANASYLFVLDAAQQAALAAAMTANGVNFSNTFVGASASAGCTGSEITDNCKPADGGPESFSLVRTTAATTVPEPSTVLLLGTGLVGLARFAGRRIRQR